MTRKDVLDRLTQLFNDYADEAEHQEGEEYWDEFFTNDEAAVADFIQYQTEIWKFEGENGNR